MKIFFQNKKYNLYFNNIFSFLTMSKIQLKGIKIFTSDQYLIKDAHGIYLTFNENEGGN